MAFPSGLELVEWDLAGLDPAVLDVWELVEFGRSDGCAGKTILDDLPPQA
jgi:hypothetical protein